MAYIVMAIQHRSDGTQETRYVSDPYDTESAASLHADIVRVTWVDPNIRVVVKEAGGQKDQGIVVYTNAPPDYDYSYVEILDAKYAHFTGTAGTHPVIRKIAIHGGDENERLFRRDYQCGRYASGLYTSLSQEDFDRSVELGMIEIDEEVTVPGPSPTGALCADCLCPSSVDDIGTVCQQCGRGIIIGSGLEDHNG